MILVVVVLKRKRDGGAFLEGKERNLSHMSKQSRRKRLRLLQTGDRKLHTRSMCRSWENAQRDLGFWLFCRHEMIYFCF